MTFDGGRMSFLKWCVVEQFFDEVDMGKDHAPTAVAPEAEGVQSVTLCVFRLQEDDVRLPFVTHNFATRKTADWNYHVSGIERTKPSWSRHHGI